MEEQGKIKNLCVLRGEKAFMICLLCRQAETLDGMTTVHFERGEMRLVVNNVPAWVCPSCGEAYVEEDVAARLLHDADAMSAAGEIEAIHDYVVFK